jgi:hypothetical protein
MPPTGPLLGARALSVSPAAAHEVTVSDNDNALCFPALGGLSKGHGGPLRGYRPPFPECFLDDFFPVHGCSFCAKAGEAVYEQVYRKPGSRTTCSPWEKLALVLTPQTGPLPTWFSCFRFAAGQEGEFIPPHSAAYSSSRFPRSSEGRVRRSGT